MKRILILMLAALSACATVERVADQMARDAEACKAKGGAYVVGRGCVMPQPQPVEPVPTPNPPPPAPEPVEPLPPVDPTPPPDDIRPTPPGMACQVLGHTGPAAFRKGMDERAKQFRVEPDELEGRSLTRGRITALVTGFAELADPDRDSFSLLMETLHPNGYRVVFSADTWRHGRDMITRFTAQHFPPGAPRVEKMDEFEHWLEPEKSYLFDCAWTETKAECTVSEAGGGWTAKTSTPILYALGPVDRPLIFGDMAANYQSMGPAAMVERACITIN